jgi:hypothetical protein
MGTSVAASGRSLHIARPEDNDGLVDEENGFVEATRLTEACAYADIHKALGARNVKPKAAPKEAKSKRKPRQEENYGAAYWCGYFQAGCLKIGRSAGALGSLIETSSSVATNRPPLVRTNDPVTTTC